jgi:HTH-type transcriptional regulator/antitoxin HigA
MSGDYMRLVLEFPLRPLRTDREYGAAAVMLDRLAVQAEGSLSPGARDYMETLTLLVEAYDDERFKIKTKSMTPLEVLNYLMEQCGMTAGELGKLLDNRALASLILNGHRELSKAHIRLLSEHFKVEPGLFLETD